MIHTVHLKRQMGVVWRVNKLVKYLHCGINISMSMICFYDWIKNRELLHFNEVSNYFDHSGFNQLFYQKIDELLDQISNPEMRVHLLKMKKWNFVAFVDTSVRNAGFREFEADEIVSLILQKMLLGGFFRDWKGQPLDRRFSVSVNNAIKNLIQKRNTRKRILPSFSINSKYGDYEISQFPNADEDTISSFREYLLKTYGKHAVIVFDERLSGGQIKELIGIEGVETSYKLKELVKKIKLAAIDYLKNDSNNLKAVTKAGISDLK